MNCKNCGTELNENDKVCPVCGARTDNESRPTEAISSKKSKKNLIVSICVAVLAILLAIGTAVAVILSRDKAPVDRTLTPEEQYRKIEEKFISETSATISEYVDDMKEGMSETAKDGDVTAVFENKTSNNSIELELNEDVVTALSLIAGKDLSFIKNIGIDIDASAKDNKSELNVALRTDDNKIISAVLMLDPDNNTVYVSLTELNKTPLKLDYNGTIGALAAKVAEETEAERSVNAIYEVIEALPEGSELQKYVAKYTDIILDGVGAVTREEATLGTESVSIPSASFTVTFTEETLKSIVNALITEAQNDKELWNDVTAVLNAIDPAIAENNELVQSGVNGDLSAYLAKADEKLTGFGDVTVTTYANAEGEILGREIIHGSSKIFVYAFASENNRIAKLLVEEENSTRLEIISEGNEADGLYNGTIAIKTADQAVATVKLTDISTSEYFGGKIEIIPSETAKALIPLALTALEEKLGIDFSENNILSNDLWISAEANSDEANVKFDITLYNGEESLVTLRFDNETTEASEITVPTSAADLSNQFEALAWVFGLDVNGFVNNLPEGLREYATELLGEAVKSYLK